MNVTRVFFLGALLLCVPATAQMKVSPPHEIPSAGLDYTPSASGLSIESGAYAPSLPLPVLPGRNGQAPSIALVYSAGRPNGLAGAGWGLSMESSVERKGAYGGAPLFDSSDTFYIDGRQLVPDGSGYYRTLQDDYTLYTAVRRGDSSGPIAGWTAVRNGRTSRYGGTSRSASTTDANAIEYRDETHVDDTTHGGSGGHRAGGEHPFRWLLSATLDAYGNSVSYRYTLRTTAAVSWGSPVMLRHLPDSIIYNARAANQYNQVQFGYTDGRKDVRAVYEGGRKTYDPFLLTSIDVRRFWNSTTECVRAHYYTLSYTYATYSNQALLQSVKQHGATTAAPVACSAAPSLSQAITLAQFTYEDSPTSWDAHQPIWLAGDVREASPDYTNSTSPNEDEDLLSTAVLTDLNGDSRPDLVVLNDVCSIDSDWWEASGRIREPADDGIDDDDVVTLPPGTITRYGCRSTHRVFLNTLRDGEVELVYDQTRSTQLTDAFQSSTQNGWHDSYMVPRGFQFIDLNRDGYAELLVEAHRETGGSVSAGFALYGGPASWEAASFPAPWLGEHFSEWARLADVNADGFPDLVTNEVDALVPTHTYAIRLSGGDAAMASGKDPFAGAASTLLDLEGMTASARCTRYDELVRVPWQSGLGTWSSGRESHLPELTDDDEVNWIWHNTQIADFNHDGFADLLVNYAAPDLDTYAGHAAPQCDEIFLGDGMMSFSSAGYGIGALSMQESAKQTRKYLLWSGGDQLTGISYEYPVNTFAMGDVDGDGRTEMFNDCLADEGYAARVMWDRGVNPTGGAAPGYQGVGGKCPSSFTAAGPNGKSFYGSSMLDYHYATIADLDSDGMQDAVYFDSKLYQPGEKTSTDASPWVGGMTVSDGLSPLVSWSRSTRRKTQNRLTAIAYPHGGTARLDWTHSALGDSAVPMNVGVIGSIEDETGTTRYGFTEAGYGDGRLLGFGRVEIATPRGATEVRTFNTTVALERKPVTEELYDADGDLRRLRVHVHASPHAADELTPDSTAPYFSPEVRMCETELVRTVLSLPVNVDSWIAACRNFSEETSGPPTAAPAAKLVLALPETHRSYVTEWTTSWVNGLVTQKRDYRDISTMADSTVQDFTHYSWSNALGGANLATSTSSDRFGHTSRRDTYPSYSQMDWLTHRDYDTNTGTARTETRTFDSMTGGMSSSTDMMGRVTWFRYSDRSCGQQVAMFTPTGYGAVIAFDEACRTEATYSTYTASPSTATIASVARIANTTFVRDALGRVTSETVDADGSGNSAIPQVQETTVYAAHAPAGAPSRIIVRAEPDSTLTLEKEYLDPYGREFSRVVCRGNVTSGTITESTDLDTYYPCDTSDPADMPITTLSIRYRTGDLAIQAGPYTAAEFSGGQAPARSFTYDEFGRRISTLGPESEAWTYEYGLGRREGTDANGIRTEVTWTTLEESASVAGVVRATTRKDAFGRVIQEIDAAGGVTDIAWDGHNRKATVTLPAVSVLPSSSVAADCSSAIAVSQRPVRTWTYFDDDAVSQETNANGNGIRYSYLSDGRLSTVTGSDSVAKETHTYTDGAFGRRSVAVLDDIGNTRSTLLDGMGRTWKETASDGASTQSAFDTRGRLSSTTLPWGEVLARTYWRSSALKTLTSTQGTAVAVTAYEVNGRGQVTREVDADGQVMQRSWDRAGRLRRSLLGNLESEAHAYDPGGREILTTRAGAVSSREYDDLGRVIRQREGYRASDDSDLAHVAYTYTLLDQVDTESDGSIYRIDHDYDAHGRKIRSRTMDAAGSTSHRDDTLEYDAEGKVTRSMDGVSAKTCTSYDALERVSTTRAPGEGAAAYAYVRRPAHPITGAASSNVLLTQLTLAGGEAFRTYTDGEGRPVISCGSDHVCDVQSWTSGLLRSTARHPYSAAAATLTSATPYATKYVEYHPSSARVMRDWDWLAAAEARTCRTTSGDMANCTPRYAHVTTTYTAAGRADTVTDAQKNETRYTYEKAGGTLLTTGAARAGVRTEIIGYDATYPIPLTYTTEAASGGESFVQTVEYDRYLRLKSVARAGGAAPTDTIAYGYNSAGWQDSTSYARSDGASVSIARVFDPRGLLKERTYDIRTTGTAPPVSKAFSYAYRADGLLENVRYPSGNEVVYRYAPGTHLLESIQTVTGAWVARLSEYDTQGRANVWTLGNVDTMRLARTFDSSGRESARTLVNGVTAPMYARSEALAYDDVGRLLTLNASELYATATTAVPSSYTSAYSYNARGFLTNEAHTGFATGTDSVGYEYAGGTGLLSSRTTAMTGVPGSTSYTYGPGNKLSAVGDVAVSFDSFGRMARDHRGQTFTWGPADQLLSMTSGSDTEQSLHDAEGARVARVSGGGTEYFLSGGAADQLLEQIDGTGAVTDYVRLNDGTLVGALDASGNVSPVVNSVLGSPYRLGTYTSGSYNYRDYTGFGEILQSRASRGDQITFHGMMTGAGGTEIAGLRAYDAWTGRFLSPDPLRFGSAADLNDSADLYRYAQNNPVAMRDAGGARAVHLITLAEASNRDPRFAMNIDWVFDMVARADSKSMKETLQPTSWGRSVLEFWAGFADGVNGTGFETLFAVFDAYHSAGIENSRRELASKSSVPNFGDAWAESRKSGGEMPMDFNQSAVGEYSLACDGCETYSTVPEFWQPYPAFGLLFRLMWPEGAQTFSINGQFANFQTSGTLLQDNRGGLYSSASSAGSPVMLPGSAAGVSISTGFVSELPGPSQGKQFSAGFGDFGVQIRRSVAPDGSVAVGGVLSVPAGLPGLTAQTSVTINPDGSFALSGFAVSWGLSIGSLYKTSGGPFGTYTSPTIQLFSRYQPASPTAVNASPPPKGGPCMVTETAQDFTLDYNAYLLQRRQPEIRNAR